MPKFNENLMSVIETEGEIGLIMYAATVKCGYNGVDTQRIIAKHRGIMQYERFCKKCNVVTKWSVASAQCVTCRRASIRARWADPVKGQTFRESTKMAMQRNSAYYQEAAMRRHAAKKDRTPTWQTEADRKYMVAMYNLAKAMSKLSGIPHEVDHIVPLQGRNVSGLHVANNLQIIPAKLNRAKLNHF